MVVLTGFLSFRFRGRGFSSLMAKFFDFFCMPNANDGSEIMYGGRGIFNKNDPYANLIVINPFDL